mmetsp:Transcript_67508/g.119706  ORF Transcript_67508/g.119706 Transcript_67508/m.119706 type:complete len:214 (+) Transcript_67508:517-1158(+)
MHIQTAGQQRPVQHPTRQHTLRAAAVRRRLFQGAPAAEARTRARDGAAEGLYLHPKDQPPHGVGRQPPLPPLPKPVPEECTRAPRRPCPRTEPGASGMHLSAPDQCPTAGHGQSIPVPLHQRLCPSQQAPPAPSLGSQCSRHHLPRPVGRAAVHQLQPPGPHQGGPQGLDGIPAAGGGAANPEGGQEGEAHGRRAGHDAANTDHTHGETHGSA